MPVGTQKKAQASTQSNDAVMDPATSSTQGSGAVSAAGAAAVQRTLDQGDSKATGLGAVFDRIFGPGGASKVLGHISEDQITKWGDSLAGDITSTLGTEINSAMTTSSASQNAINKLSTQIITNDLKAQLQAFIASPEGKQIASNIAGYFDGSTEAVLTEVLLGAAYFVLLNGKLPELSTSQNLGGGFSVKEHVDLGTLRSLALRSVGAELSYKNGNFQADVGASYLSGDAASSAVGGKGSSAKVHAPGLAPEHVTALTASIQDKVGDWTLKGTNTTDLAGGRVVNGVAAFSAGTDFGGGKLALGVQDKYAGANEGVSGTVSYTAQISHDSQGRGMNISAQGSVSPNGQWSMAIVGVIHF